MAETPATATSFGDTPLPLHVAWHATAYPASPSSYTFTAVSDPDDDYEPKEEGEREEGQWSPASDAHSIALETMDGHGGRARSLA